MSFSDSQSRTILAGLVAELDKLIIAGGTAVPRLAAARFALGAIGDPTAAPGDPGAPPPTNPFPPTADPSRGAAQVVIWAAYSPQHTAAAWALTKTDPITLRLDT